MSVLYGWGQSVGLFLKDGSMQRVLKSPKRLNGLKDYVLPSLTITHLAAGWGHSLVASEKGELYSVGLNQSGQLGNGRCEARGFGNLPSQGRVLALACGREHSHVLTCDQLYSFGNNMYGQLGIGKNRQSAPGELVYANRLEKVELTGVQGVTCGLDHSMVVTERGVYGMGWSADGQLGQGDQDQARPRRLRWEQAVQKVTSSSDFSLALTQDGQVWTWGNSEYGQGGQGKKVDRILEPVKIPWAEEIRDVAAGGPFSVFLTKQGQVYTCGFGALGCGEGVESLVPKKIHGLDNVQRVFASTDYAAALTENGALFSWGLNGISGRLGLGHSEHAFTPQRVPIDPPVRDVALGVYHALALVSES
ncbi:regulator of chromosome condensation 1/beta-lactamase-inhibitor protein II [Sporodiniella umbellata]|nr:regulator of chromosome condensation 1/beta-lactamase-inhibitor protein II [Sporodiniella umbellata]